MHLIAPAACLTRRTLALAAVLLVACLRWAAAPAAALPDYAAERALFVEAQSLIRKGQFPRAAALEKRLSQYPLRPYLEYERLRLQISRTAPATLARFISEHADSPLSERLRFAWLDRLAATGRWADYLDRFVETRSSRHRCHEARALIETGRVAEGLDRVPALWLTGESRPDACDFAFAYWRNSARFDPALVMDRIELAMERRQTGLVRYLTRFLSEEERGFVDAWLRARARPSVTVEMARHTGVGRRLLESALADVLVRFAGRSPEEAARALPEVDRAFPLSERARASVLEAIARSYAYKHDRSALAWFARVPASLLSGEGREWFIRAALLHRDWEAAHAALAGLAPEDASADAWRYWSGVVMGHRDRADAAQSGLRALAESRSYYAFLAADRVGAEYRFNASRLSPAPALVDALLENGNVRRAHELLVLERRIDARREWRMLLKGLDEEGKAAAASLAHDWQWHGRAILTIAKTTLRDDIELRFPLAYRDLVEHSAGQRQIDPAWVFAIARQESAFMPDARSPKGALGLMQIMPATGRSIARSLGTRLGRVSRLTDPAVNLSFGTRYMQTLQEKFSGHPALVSAAYNAGPNRVLRWLPETGSVDGATWVENIPYRETRSYVQRVLAYTAVFEHRLGRTPARLSERLGAVPNRDELTRRAATAPSS